MKERLTLALSWYAFAHAAILVPALGIVLSVEFLDLELARRGFIETSFGAYFGIYEAVFGFKYDVPAIFGASPAIWFGLWLTTGKPKFLPWRR